MLKYSAYLIFALFTVSCANDRRHKLTDMVEEWQGKQIVFPKKMIFSVYGENAMDFSIPDTEYKVLVYTDSIGCTSCKLRLGEWKEFIHEVDSLTDGHVPFLFFFHAKRESDLVNQLKAFRIDVPVCMDREDMLNRLNSFPSDMQFQTFLIDRKNCVRVIGNPVNNPNIKNLYLKMIKSSKRKEVAQGKG